MSPDVIVVGAGCAGLAAATALVERGARVLVLEARPILGERASAVRDAATGETLDNGQHVLMGCYDDTLAFLDRIGSSDRVRRQTGLSVTMTEMSGRRSTLHLPPLPAPLHLLAGVLAWDALSWGEKLSVLRAGAVVAGAGRAHARTERRDFSPGVTVREWLVSERSGAAPRRAVRRRNLPISRIFISRSSGNLRTKTAGPAMPVPAERKTACSGVRNQISINQKGLAAYHATRLTGNTISQRETPSSRPSATTSITPCSPAKIAITRGRTRKHPVIATPSLPGT